MPTRIAIEKDIILWAIRVSDKTIEDARDKFTKFDEWLEGELDPTFNQVKSLSNFTRVPFGYFFLKEPPEEEIDLLEFRTIDSEYIDQPSRELIDTINEMKYRQEWMRDYLIQQNYPKNKMVGSLNRNNIDSITEAATFILNQLDLPYDWKKKKRRASYNYLKQITSDHGIMVMQNGVVKNNNYRKLNLNEFRAFTMIDEYAPLIFINNNDTMNGKTFSLLHELVHIFIGQNSFYNENIPTRKNKYKNEDEIFSNAIAAEILLPKNEYYESVRINMRRKNREKSGGDFHNTQLSRIDDNFIYALSNGLDRGYANFTDIYKLTGLSRKNYKKMEEKLTARE